VGLAGARARTVGEGGAASAEVLEDVLDRAGSRATPGARAAVGGVHRGGASPDLRRSGGGVETDRDAVGSRAASTRGRVMRGKRGVQILGLRGRRNSVVGEEIQW
jgi:hypothetical protein